jgi:AAA+ ATPase superfamily predicted ATPase
VTTFVGRKAELAALSAVLGEITTGGSDGPSGRCLLIRGRRRIGKSSLVEAFLQRSGVPSVFFTAAGAPVEQELAELSIAVARSTLPGRDVFAEAVPGNWSAALRLLGSALPDDRASVIVIDEVPYLMASVDGFEGVLQRVWDRDLSRRPVLLILIGSDLSMMESLGSYGRPFHQRGQEMVLGPLSPADVARMARLEPAAAFEAALVTGGLPLICSRWRPGDDLWDFLRKQFADPLSPLLVSAERSLAAEFRDQTYARIVLGAVGAGERTFTNIARAAGGISASTLSRAVDLLVTKRMIAAELPVSLTPSRERRYRLVDPYLRFWLTFVRPHLPEIERMRGDLALTAVRERWESWRGQAIEPLLRESLARLLPAAGLPAAHVVGGYWTRSNDVEIDIVGADREPVARRLLFLGSIKWRERSPFDQRDLVALRRQATRVTDEPVPLVAVSRTGVRASGLAASFAPADLLGAWTNPRA